MSFLEHSGLRALGIAAIAAIALSACSGGSANDELPLIRATVTLKTVSQGGVCDAERVRMTPKQLSGVSNKYANNRMMVTEINMTGPTDEGGAPMCNGTGETLPLATGVWEFSAPLASGTTSCERDIQADGDLLVALVDGVDGCGGSNGAPADAAAPAEGETPAEGEAPAESADTAAPAGG